jgi:hypothetical protein
MGSPCDRLRAEGYPLIHIRAKGGAHRSVVERVAS